MWNKAENMLKEAADELGLSYEEAIGEAGILWSETRCSG